MVIYHINVRGMFSDSIGREPFAKGGEAGDGKEGTARVKYFHGTVRDENATDEER